MIILQIGVYLQTPHSLRSRQERNQQDYCEVHTGNLNAFNQSPCHILVYKIGIVI